MESKTTMFSGILLTSMNGNYSNKAGVNDRWSGPNLVPVFGVSLEHRCTHCSRPMAAFMLTAELNN